MKSIFKNFTFFHHKSLSLQFYLLMAILVVAAILRFYNYPYRYSLGEETIRDAVIGIEGARQLQFPLTGSFSSLGPFTFGPWYAYQLIIFSIVFPFLFSPWVYLSIISVVYVFIIYKVGQQLIGKNFGLMLALIAAISPAQIISATHLTSHNNTNLFAILAIWIFLKLISKNISYWWGFSLGMIIGIGMNLHFQMTGLLILPLILLIYKRKKYLYFVTASLGVFVSFIPLLIFEMNNHWFTTRNLAYYMLYGKNAIYVPNRWLFYVRDFWPAFWSDALGVPTYVGIIIIILFLFAISWLLIKKKLPLQILLLLIAFSFNFLLLRYYWGPRFFGYLNFLRPFVFIFTGFTIFSIYKFKFGKYFASIFFIAMVVLILPGSIERLNKDSFSIKIFDEMSILENKFPGKKFSLYGCSNYYRGSYNSVAFSALFILDLDKKVDNSGMKIGLDSKDCEYPKNKINNSSTDTKNPYLPLNNIGILNFSSATEVALLEKGWKPITFSGMYDSYARWWFKEQP